MRRKIGLLLMVNLILLAGTVFSAPLPTYEVDQAVLVYEVKSDDIVTMQNESEKMYPASTTKLLTALIAIENGDLNELITIGSEINNIDFDSSVAKLEKEEIMTLRDLLYGLLLPSGNDAANVIALNVGRKMAGGTELTDDEAFDLFIDGMNKKAQALGMTDSHFANPHGLHNSDHYSTAVDLLKLAQATFADQTIASITRSKTHKITSNKVDHVWETSNLMLYTDFDELSAGYREMYGLAGPNPYFNGYATSGKTGNTDQAGRCLVFKGEGNGKEVIGVILNSSEEVIFSDASRTIDAVVKEYDFITWTQDGKIENFYAETKVDNYHIFDGSTLKLQTSAPLITLVKESEKDNYTAKIKWDDQRVRGSNDLIEILADVESGDQLGELEVYNGEVLAEVAPIYANNGIKARSFIDYPIIYWYVTIIVILMVLAILRIAFVHFMRKNRIKYKKIKIKTGGNAKTTTKKSRSEKSKGQPRRKKE